MASSTATRTPATSWATPTRSQIVFLDLGLVGQLDSTQRMDLLGLIYAIKESTSRGSATA